MVGLLDFNLTLGANLHGLHYLGVWHIALVFNWFNLYVPKSKIVDDLLLISPIKMISTFKWCHLSTGILTLKVNVHVSYTYYMLVLTLLGGGYSTSSKL